MQPPVAVPYVDDVPTVPEAVADEADLGRATLHGLAGTAGSCIEQQGLVVAAALIPADRAFSGVPVAVWLALDLVVAAAVHVGLAIVFRLRARRELRSLASTYFGRPAIT